MSRSRKCRLSLPSYLTMQDGCCGGRGLKKPSDHFTGMASSILSSHTHIKPNCNGTASLTAPTLEARNGYVPQHDNLTPPHSVEPLAPSPTSAEHNGKLSHDNKNISNGSATLTDQNANPSHDDKKKGRHAAIGHKTVLQSDALYQYVLETSVYPRECPYQKELREITAQHPWNLMTTPPDEGQFLMLLMKLINAKNTMELGVYTGYSLLSTALALPDDGKIIAIDINRDNYELGAPVLEKAGLSHKIDFREGLILPQLEEMLLEERNHGFFDFIFVDADKDNYVNYHERLLKLVKVGGVIGYDNTLWNGSLVAPEDAPYPKYVRHYRPFVLELNRVLAGDKRIEISQVPIGDGITLCRRIE